MNTKKINHLSGLHTEVFRFAVVGILATVVHIIIYTLSFPAFTNSAALANIVSFGIAVVASYTGNAYWVFPGAYDHRLQIMKFGISSGTGAALNTFFAWYVVDVSGASKYLSVILMVTVTPMVIFVINKFFVFADSK